MKILVISSNYPSLQTPNYGAFVYNLMQEMAKDHQITVISPFKLHQLWKPKQNTYGNESCQLKRPVFLSLSNKKLGVIDTGRISHYSYKRAIQKELKTLKERPDVIYTHFIANAIPILDYASGNSIPIVVASGESTYTSLEQRSDEIKQKLIESIAHIICVSRENKEQLIKIGFKEDRISVIPNAVDYSLFKPLDKEQSKINLGLATDKFTVGFIGHFIHRKGPNRIIEAIEELNDKDIQLVCVGSRGELKENDFTTILSPVPNMKLPEIYNAFDVFVLPTLHEGSCNVIEEAKACCLPIISSRGTSVEEQIEDDVTGVLVNPMDIAEISSAIARMKEDEEYRVKFTNTLMSLIGENSLKNRTKKIINRLREVVSK